MRVPFEESLRKNQRRFNPDKPDSILEYGLTDSMMERLYRKDDWSILATHDSGSPGIREHNVRCVVFPDEDDVTTGKSYRLAA
jgi:hypothetical protein